MQFEIQSSTLLPILNTMSRLIGSKPLIPILENVKFYEKDGQYLITATSGDQEAVLTAVLPLENVVDFHPFLVPVCQLCQMVKAAEGSIFPLTFKTGTHNGGKSGDKTLGIDYGEGEYQIFYLDVDEYPVTKVGELSAPITVPSSVVSAMTTAKGFTSSDDLRPIMQCVYLDITTEGVMRVVGCDQRTMFVTNIRDIQSTSNVGILFKANIISTLSNLLPKDARLNIQTGAKFVVIDIVAPTEDGGSSVLYRIESRNVEGRYPPYNRIIPNTSESILIDSRTFLKAVERAAVCANDATKQLRFDIVPGQSFITVKAQDVEKSRNSRTSLEVKDGCVNVHSATSVGFRYDFLTRCIGAINTKDIAFNFVNATKAFLLNATDGNTTVLIMPQQLLD